MSVNHTTESWRSVKEYGSYYEVSDQGRLRSLHAGHGNTPGTLKKWTDHAQGYKATVLYRGDGSARGFLVHRLVAEAFLGEIPVDCEINHLDGDKHNNCVGNLEIVTRQQNIDHAVEHGLIDNKGERNSSARLTAEQVLEIRSRYRHGGGPGYKALAKEYGVSWESVRDIIKRRNWWHVPR